MYGFENGGVTSKNTLIPGSLTKDWARALDRSCWIIVSASVQENILLPLDMSIKELLLPRKFWSVDMATTVDSIKEPNKGCFVLDFKLPNGLDRVCFCRRQLHWKGLSFVWTRYECVGYHANSWLLWDCHAILLCQAEVNMAWLLQSVCMYVVLQRKLLRDTFKGVNR